MREAAAFLKPIAHRGFHGALSGCTENTREAFEAALAKGYGIECDLRPARGGTPMVFHDATLERLVDETGPVAAHDADTLQGFKYRDAASSILKFSDLLDLVAGREPILAEIKSEWDPPDRPFVEAIAARAAAYRGPLALMSFDPAVMAAIRELAPDVPRGIVSGKIDAEDPHWSNRLGADRAFRLTNLLESRQAAPDFYAYQVGALEMPVTRFVREVLSMPVFTWTVRTPQERKAAERWADAPIFEGYEP